MKVAPSLRVALLVSLGAIASFARAATFTVTTAADSGAGSLRQAILDANGNPGADTIAFNIPGGGVKTIDVASEMDVTDPVVIDGYTQPGSSPNTDPAASNAVITIEIRAGNGYDGSGIVVTGGGLEIHGVSIHGFDVALSVGGAGASFVGGCFVGLAPSGAPDGNDAGIAVQGTGSAGIGDGSPANRNVISANLVGVFIDGAGGGVVKGNLIGTDAAGTGKVGNGYGVYVNTTATVGGPTAAQGNVISGNTGDGVHVLGYGSVIEGNRIGLDATGLQPLGNGGSGVFASAGSPTIDHNFVSANASHGIDLSASSGCHVFVNYIGSNVLGLGELGNGGAGVHSVSASGTINSNWIAHNQYGLWIESQAPFGPATSWSSNSIFDNGGLGIVEGNPPAIAGPAAVITSVVPNAATTTITGFIYVPVGAHVPTSVGIEFFSSPACSKKRPRDFDEGKTYLGGVGFAAFGSPVSFSADVPVVITDEVVTATAGYMDCFPFGEGGCVPGYWSGPFSQRLVYSISPPSGSPAGGDAIAIAGGNLAADSIVTIGGQAVVNPNVVNGGEIDATTPALPAGSVNDVVVTNIDGSGGTLALAFLADFLDVPPAQHVPRLRADGGDQRRRDRSRRRQLRRRREHAAPADGGLPAEGQARHLLHATAVRGDLRRRALPVALRRLDRGPRGRGDHGRLRRRQLLPGRRRAARPDGGVPSQGRARILVRAAGVCGRIHGRGVPVALRRLDRAARRRERHGRLRRRQLLPAEPEHARADGGVPREDVPAAVESIRHPVRQRGRNPF